MLLYRIILILPGNREVKGHWLYEEPSLQEIESDMSIFKATSYRLETKEAIGSTVFLYLFSDGKFVEKIVTDKELKISQIENLEKKCGLPFLSVEALTQYCLLK